MRAVMTERAEVEKLKGKAWGDTCVIGFGKANIFEKMVYYMSAWDSSSLTEYEIRKA